MTEEHRQWTGVIENLVVDAPMKAHHFGPTMLFCIISAHCCRWCRLRANVIECSRQFLDRTRCYKIRSLEALHRITQALEIRSDHRRPAGQRLKDHQPESLQGN